MTDRRRTRRKLLLVGCLPLLLAVALSGKVAWMEVHARSGESAVAAGSYDDARRAYADSGVLNILEPWVATYNEGVAAISQDDAEAAVELFSDALELAPPQAQCRVRTNLAIAQLAASSEGWEADGRSRIELSTAREAVAPCLPDVVPAELEEALSADEVDDLREDLTETDLARSAEVDSRLAERLEELARALEAQVNRSPQTDPTEPDATDPPAEQLEQLNAQGRQEREEFLRSRRPPKPPASSEDSEDEDGKGDNGPVYNW